MHVNHFPKNRLVLFQIKYIKEDFRFDALECFLNVNKIRHKIYSIKFFI